MADVDRAQGVAARIIRAFTKAVPYWKTLTAEQQNAFLVEIVDEADRPVLVVHFRDITDPSLG
ncbi:hypothetical protein [Microvirga sp. M2]|uniref:hypothetical protein n=1 Tax=Microvirga sp. M2 TaxID=3073270 RepID=UPI0039C238FB